MIGVRLVKYARFEIMARMHRDGIVGSEEAREAEKERLQVLTIPVKPVE